LWANNPWKFESSQPHQISSKTHRDPRVFLIKPQRVGQTVGHFGQISLHKERHLLLRAPHSKGHKRPL
ncbi:MAG: hypothetical protein VXA09_02310, partial [Burkholderiaceae bacterium]